MSQHHDCFLVMFDARFWKTHVKGAPFLPKCLWGYFAAQYTNHWHTVALQVETIANGVSGWPADQKGCRRSPSGDRPFPATAGTGCSLWRRQGVTAGLWDSGVASSSVAGALCDFGSVGQLLSLRFISQPSPWRFDTPPPHAPLFAWCPCFCCSTCAALTRAWRAPAGASPVLSPLDRTPTCCPCLLPAVTHGGALGLQELGTGRAGTTAGAGSGASPCAKSLGAGSATETVPGGGWL